VAPHTEYVPLSRCARHTGPAALTPEDAASGAPPVFVMSYKLWSKRYGLDRSIVTKHLCSMGLPTTLVGIMPPRFTKMGADLWWSVSINGQTRK